MTVDLGAFAAARIELTTNFAQFAGDMARAKAELGAIEQPANKAKSNLMNVFSSAKELASGFIDSVVSVTADSWRSGQAGDRSQGLNSSPASKPILRASAAGRVSGTGLDCDKVA